MENNLILIGMPAVGKSTVGVILAKRLGKDFIDTDLLIQSGEGMRLFAIIREKGLAGFREMEAAYAGNVAAENAVIATGGSVVYSDTAMERLREKGVVVYLKMDLAGLSDRLADLDGRGVVRQPGQTLADLFAERTPLYEQWADVVVDCKSLTPEEVVTRIRSHWEDAKGGIR